MHPKARRQAKAYRVQEPGAAVYNAFDRDFQALMEKIDALEAAGVEVKEIGVDAVTGKTFVVAPTISPNYWWD